MKYIPQQLKLIPLKITNFAIKYLLVSFFILLIFSVKAQNFGDKAITTNHSYSLSANYGDLQMKRGPNDTRWKRALATFTDHLVINSNGDFTDGVRIMGKGLRVDNKIQAGEVKVQVGDNWSDFVFHKDYDLPTLGEVEAHINTKGHLKDIPTAKQVAKDGISLGAMDAKLLQKIEELTLYILEQDKELKNQKTEIQGLKKQNETLEEVLKRLGRLEELVNQQKIDKN